MIVLLVSLNICEVLRCWIKSFWLQLKCFVTEFSQFSEDYLAENCDWSHFINILALTDVIY